ncbi:right-handed parallel beta-helix repeat-containing protein [Bythopirellula goksoeyrii]|uniref:Probable pectate lyase C n=1 Tax=Bythopirellula goksoeyrii TaxID=1400387 RepID=A0A5B9QFU7_9BACT|nr:right-handed parallel beta-helix repeat-containing protein [Bythopirellula goksoeyrii]QEG36442.1 Pectate lyase L precursor [Bythopirellula goksoeyrii]
MRQLFFKFVVVLCCAVGIASTDAAEFYISPGGSNGNNGSQGSPWGTFDYAIDRINPGDTLFVRGGTYSLNSRIQIRSDEGGTSNNPINIWSYPGESPVLDFDSMSNGSWGQSSGRGIQIDDGADWLHIKGLTIQNARDNGIWSGANNGIIEQVVTRWNGDSGVQLSGFAAYNQIINTDSYENYDPSSNGENADGFAIKFEDLGPGNSVRGSRAWGNSDDGWDMWGSNGGALVEDSWSFDNGKLLPQFFDKDALEDNDLTAGNFQGDATGFKLGQDGGAHVLNRVLAWENKNGIDINGNGTGVIVNNSVGFNNTRNWYFDETASETDNLHILKNNISYDGNSSDVFLSGVIHSFNTWNGIPVNSADFLSLDDAIARGPRNPDGSLPTSDFLRLASDSNLIDAGTDVGLPFNDSAPDLGAFETSPIVFAAGDFNEDGFVDSTDLISWQAGYGTPSGAAHGDGDADEDGDVDGIDFLVWQREYAPALPLVSNAVAVPEPTTLLFVIVATFALCIQRPAGF